MQTRETTHSSHTALLSLLTEAEYWHSAFMRDFRGKAKILFVIRDEDTQGVHTRLTVIKRDR